VNGSTVWSGKLGRAAPHKFNEPLKWRKPRLVFVNSMGDLFHEDAPREWIDAAFEVMKSCPQHRFQVLTKRHDRMRDYMRDRDPLPNVWLGVSVEDQRRAEERLPVLLGTPAAIRFASVEPMLEPVDLRPWLHSLDWVIVGGESGEFLVFSYAARPFNLAWARDVLAQCRAAGVPCFVKQMGSIPVDAGERIRLRADKGGDITEWPEDISRCESFRNPRARCRPRITQG